MFTPQTGSYDLAPLYDRCLFRSDSRVHTHEVTARELSDHDLTWKGGVIDTAMYKRSVRDLHLYALKYGAEVEVRPVVFNDLVLVHTVMRGAMEVECDGQRLTIGEGRTGWMAPSRDVKLSWSTASEHLLLKVPRAMMQALVPDGAAPSAVRLLPMASSATWMSLTQGLLHASRIAADSPARDAWVRHYESMVAAFLASHEHDAAASLNGPLAPASSESSIPAVSEGARGADRHRLDAMLRYMQERLSAPISLSDLAAAANLSVRALQALCRRHMDAAPMDLLRHMRLDAVRARLQAGDCSNVTEVALEYGFAHLGRFSGYYRERFGELPSQTQADAETRRRMRPAALLAHVPL